MTQSIAARSARLLLTASMLARPIVTLLVGTPPIAWLILALLWFGAGDGTLLDALHRRESCGGHFRGESQTEDGEALRDDAHYSYVAAWEFGASEGEDALRPVLHKEDLVYTAIEMKQRSYK